MCPCLLWGSWTGSLGTPGRDLFISMMWAQPHLLSPLYSLNLAKLNFPVFLTQQADIWYPFLCKYPLLREDMTFNIANKNIPNSHFLTWSSVILYDTKSMLIGLPVSCLSSLPAPTPRISDCADRDPPFAHFWVMLAFECGMVAWAYFVSLTVYFYRSSWDSSWPSVCWPCRPKGCCFPVLWTSVLPYSCLVCINSALFLTFC